MKTTTAEDKRVPLNTNINDELLRGLKLLSVEQGKRYNDMLEEAIADLLRKYGKC